MKRIAIIGAGKGGYALFCLLKDISGIEVVGIADRDKNAPGIKLAKASEIFATDDYNDLLKIKDIDIIINVTGSPQVSKEIKKKRDIKAEIVEGMSARLIWDLLNELKAEHDGIQRNLAESKKLYDIAIILASAHHLEDVLDTIIKESTEFVNAPAGSIAFYDAGAGELRIAASKGFSPKFLEINRWKVRPNGMTAHILGAKKPVAISDIKKEPLFNNPLMLEEGVRSLIAVPLLANSRIIGILYIDDFKPRRWTANEISFLSLLGTQATFAIEKHQLLKELKDNTDSLLETKDYLKNVLNDSADIIITTDTFGRIVEFNGGAERTLGYKIDEVIGRPASELYYNRDERIKILGKMGKDGGVSNYETQLAAKGGRVVDISLSLSHLHNSAGKVIGTVGISKDITQEKQIRIEIDNKNRELKEVNDRLEERILERTLELEHANKGLERSNRVKNQFIANMSHELRTPLNSIIGFSDILLTDAFGSLNEKQARYANNVLTSGRHLLQLINNILDIAKIEAGRMTLDYSTFQLPAIIDEVMTIVQPLAAKKAVILEVKLDPELTEITADEIKLKQILYNLLSNAIKFTPQDGRVAFVAEKGVADSSGQGGQLLKISVIDTGIGIRTEDIDKVFEEFEQVDGSYSRRHEGLGLGLTLTKKLVELHGGIIRAESQFGKGSTFSFIMPTVISVQDSSELLVGSSEKKQFLHIPDSEFRTEVNAPLVLVVEDDLPTSELITIHLAKAGYLVAHAFDGNEAIKKARELKPFAITLDVMLPYKDGWEVLQDLKSHEETKDIPVIINSIISNKELGFVLGAADYLVKPVDGARLIERLNELRPTFKKSSRHATILLIEKDEKMARSMSGALEVEGFSVLRVKGGEEGIELALVAMPDLIIVDMMFNGLSELSSFDIIHRLKNIPATQGIPVFLLTEKEMGTDERLKVMGYIDRVIEKDSFLKGDIVDQIKKLESLYPKRAGLVDEVTGLFNHRYLNIRLNQETKRADRYKQPCSFLIIAIDDLQAYIAGNGEFHGNAALRKSAELIKKTLRGYDIATRYGMDELAILLPNTSKSPALQLAKRFKAIIESFPFYNAENQPKGKISASVGVATYPDDANAMEGIILAAQNALSEAMGKGGDMVVAYRAAGSEE